MVITSTITKSTVFGDRRVSFGTFTNATAVAQVDTYTIGGVFAADDVCTVTVDTNDVAHTVIAGDTDLEGVIDALVLAINGDGTVGAIVEAVKTSATTFTLTAEVVGTAFTSSGAVVGTITLVSETTTPNVPLGTGGDISTGLALVESIKLQPTGSSVLTNASVVNESFPLASGKVTIVTDADADGVWFAIGL